jgi:phospholipase/carboxylesterase
MEPDPPYLDAVAQVGPALLHALDALEKAQRHLHPPALPELRRVLARVQGPLERAVETLGETPAPDGLRGFAEQLGHATEHALASLRGFTEPGAGPDATARILDAMRRACRAQAALYPLRSALPPVNRYFFERAVWERAETLDPESPAHRVGLHDAHDAPEERGGFHLFVPESYDGSPLPLVVALHGGGGHGGDFLWTWLREARSRRFHLLSPTSRGSTWSLMGLDRDAAALDAMIAFVGERWAVDLDHVLVTGLSDGATYALLYGLRAEAPCTALAPVSGVLHPGNFANGNIERARGRRIYLVHGALDWMFPVDLARAAAEELRRAGAELTYREIDDLSHTYPRDENPRILEWFHPALALPDPPAADA